MIAFFPSRMSGIFSFSASFSKRDMAQVFGQVFHYNPPPLLKCRIWKLLLALGLLLSNTEWQTLPRNCIKHKEKSNAWRQKSLNTQTEELGYLCSTPAPLFTTLGPQTSYLSVQAFLRCKRKITRAPTAQVGMRLKCVNLSKHLGQCWHLSVNYEYFWAEDDTVMPQCPWSRRPLFHDLIIMPAVAQQNKNQKLLGAPG